MKYYTFDYELWGTHPEECDVLELLANLDLKYKLNYKVIKNKHHTSLRNVAVLPPFTLKLTGTFSLIEKFVKDTNFLNDGDKLELNEYDEIVVV